MTRQTSLLSSITALIISHCVLQRKQSEVIPANCPNCVHCDRNCPKIFSCLTLKITCLTLKINFFAIVYLRTKFGKSKGRFQNIQVFTGRLVNWKKRVTKFRNINFKISTISYGDERCFFKKISNTLSWERGKYSPDVKSHIWTSFKLSVVAEDSELLRVLTDSGDFTLTFDGFSIEEEQDSLT